MILMAIENLKLNPLHVQNIIILDGGFPYNGNRQNKVVQKVTGAAAGYYAGSAVSGAVTLGLKTAILGKGASAVVLFFGPATIGIAAGVVTGVAIYKTFTWLF